MGTEILELRRRKHQQRNTIEESRQEDQRGRDIRSTSVETERTRARKHKRRQKARKATRKGHKIEEKGRRLTETFQATEENPAGEKTARG